MVKSIHPYEILREPIITEKSTALALQGKYVFEVHERATKPEIKRAVELAFEVTVESVNTLRVRGRRPRGAFGRRAGNLPFKKKAIVTLVTGDSIELFEGV